MSLAEQRKRCLIGQLLMFGFAGHELNDEVKGLIQEQKIGGVILFGENVQDPQQVSSLCHHLQDWNNQKGHSAPLFISIDQEGGRISRLSWLAETYPDPVLIGQGTRQEAFFFGLGLGRELSGLGININLAPVLDILCHKNSTLLATRCLSSEAQRVAELGVEIIRGLQEGGVLATGKHFPGHGDVAEDSHLQLPISNCPRETIEQRELLPYKEALASGLKLIMTAHVKYPMIDQDYPATLSSLIIQGLLRTYLGFQGLVISDDLLMKALTTQYTIEETVVLAIKAGIDILLVGHHLDQQMKVWEVLMACYEDPNLRPLITHTSQRINQFKAAHLRPVADNQLK